MNLIANREFSYKKKQILKNHPSADCYEINFLATDNSKIHIDAFFPKTKTSGVIIEFPDYKAQPKDFLNLSRYSILNLSVFSLHIRGQNGKSENKYPASIYFPFINEFEEKNYYTQVYQDALDTVSLVKKIFPNTPIYLIGAMQGGAISLVASNFYKIDSLFISNAALCDFTTIYSENYDTNFYEPIREFARNNPDKENYLLKKLNEIDIINYTKNISATVYYACSNLNYKTPKKSQDKLLSLIKNKEILNYRKFEQEILQEHFFDEFILKTLAKKINKKSL